MREYSTGWDRKNKWASKSYFQHELGGWKQFFLQCYLNFNAKERTIAYAHLPTDV